MQALERRCILYGPNKKADYLPRIVDAEIAEALRIFGALEVRGPKWCGKSWTSGAFAEKTVRIDDARNKLIAQTDPATILSSDKHPLVLDEWQDVPKLWDAVRRDVDDHAKDPGRFILTGSSTPQKEKVSHSGAGRIARIDMSTMTMLERGEVPGGVSLSKLFDGDFTGRAVETPKFSPLVSGIVRGGWPALVGSGENAAGKVVRDYLDATFEISVPARGGKTGLARRIATSLARNLGTPAKLETLAQDASSGESDTCSRFQVADYLEIFKSLYLLQELPGWDAPVKSKSRVRTKPKRYFTDTSIAPALLGLGSKRLMHDSQMLGAVFEALCVHDIGVFARRIPMAAREPLFYYADSGGLEVDIIIELADGRWAGIEVKLNDEKVAQGIHNLKRLRSKIASNPLARNPKPSFMAVVVSNIDFAYYDAENDIYILPFASLEP